MRPKKIIKTFLYSLVFVFLTVCTFFVINNQKDVRVVNASYSTDVIDQMKSRKYYYSDGKIYPVASENETKWLIYKENKYEEWITENRYFKSGIEIEIKETDTASVTLCDEDNTTTINYAYTGTLAHDYIVVSWNKTGNRCNMYNK